MQKKLIALAIAGAMAAPMAAQADKANVDIYGKAHASWDFMDGGAGGIDNDSTGVMRQSIIGFKGAEDLGNGMKAIWQYEFLVNSTAAGNTGGVAQRPAFVGLTGDWGTFAMGRQEAPYKVSTGKLDLFADTIADYNTVIGVEQTAVAGTGSNNFENRPGIAVAYVTPTINGFHAAIARVAAPSTVSNDVWSMAAVYSNGPLYAALGYENHDNLLDVDADAWKFGVGYSFGDAKVGFVYENIDVNTLGNGAVVNTDSDNYIINGAYKMGNNTFKAQFGNSDGNTAGTDDSYWAIGVDHNFSKRTKVYAVYADADNGLTLNGGNVGNYAGAGTSDVNGFSVGLVHSF